MGVHFFGNVELVQTNVRRHRETLSIRDKLLIITLVTMFFQLS
jgi:hypothetical protein